VQAFVGISFCKRAELREKGFVVVFFTVTLHSEASGNYAEKPVMQRKDRRMTKSESELVKCSVFLASLQHVHAQADWLCMPYKVCLIRHARLACACVRQVHTIMVKMV